MRFGIKRKIFSDGGKADVGLLASSASSASRVTGTFNPLGRRLIASGIACVMQNNVVEI
jgi:hypothetical protein